MNRPLVTKGPPRMAVMGVRSHPGLFFLICSSSKADTYLGGDATQAETLRRDSLVGDYAQGAHNCDAIEDLTGLLWPCRQKDLRNTGRAATGGIHKRLRRPAGMLRRKDTRCLARWRRKCTDSNTLVPGLVEELDDTLIARLSEVRIALVSLLELSTGHLRFLVGVYALSVREVCLGFSIRIRRSWRRRGHIHWVISLWYK